MSVPFIGRLPPAGHQNAYLCPSVHPSIRYNDQSESLEWVLLSYFTEEAIKAARASPSWSFWLRSRSHDPPRGGPFALSALALNTDNYKTHAPEVAK